MTINLWKKEDAAEICEKAAILLENGKWHQGSCSRIYPDGTVSYCTVGALYRVTGAFKENTTAVTFKTEDQSEINGQEYMVNHAVQRPVLDQLVRHWLNPFYTFLSDQLPSEGKPWTLEGVLAFNDHKQTTKDKAVKALRDCAKHLRRTADATV